LPTVGAFLTYIRGLKPRKRVGLAFGSYGWASQAVKEIDRVMKELGWEVPKDSVSINYIPDDEELTETQRIGKELGEILLKK
ncbi:MAG: FprA family A-type flavoprotein, partial [Candidatus Freyarchaeota archaeon]